MDKLLILTFWEIIKTNNILLLDADYTEGKIYTDAQNAEINALWSALYDSHYTQKQNSTAVMAMDKANQAILLLFKINLLTSNLEALIKLYQNQKEIIVVQGEEKFFTIEQGILRNFVNIDKKIKPIYFDGFEANYKLINRFINSYQTTYDINHKRAEQAVNKEVKNVYELVAAVGNQLGMQLNVKEMSVSEWNAYEQVAKDKNNALNQQQNGQ